MRDFINIGSSPCGETCIQVGSPDYYSKSLKECQRFITEIRNVCGKEPEGAYLKVKSFPHDFGSYHEVVCFFDDLIPDSVDYAYHVEGNSPEYWYEGVGTRLWVKAIDVKSEPDIEPSFVMR